MKKLFSFMLFMSVSFVLADPSITLDPSITPDRHQVQGTGPIAIDGLVYSQTYDYSVLVTAVTNYGGGNRWICDDFELDNNYYVTEMYVWMIWTGEMGSMMNFVISEDYTGDSDPNTNTDVWVESVPCTNTFTGDSQWGYDIYQTHCIINADAYPELDAGVHYYFETQADVNDNCFILASLHYIADYIWYNDGSGVWVRSDIIFGTPLDMFFDFYGEPVSALEPETWGSIKTLF